MQIAKLVCQINNVSARPMKIFQPKARLHPVLRQTAHPKFTVSLLVCHPSFFENHQP
jgi:hypothetical protein